MGLSCPVVTLTPGPGTIQVDWTAVTGADDYTIEVFDNSGGTGSPVDSDVTALNTITFTGLGYSTNYWVRVTPSDGGTDPTCSLQSVTTGADTVGPVVQSIVVENAAPSNVVLTYDETLTGASLSLSKWDVIVNGSSASKSSATASGTTVTIVLTTPIVNGDVVTVTYTPGTSGTRVADTVPNFALGFTNHAVTNNVI